jgi:hypothetical protein
MYKCLNNINPSIEEVRVWGYDDDLLFTEQDEDLILYGPQYVQILMELASDPESPKNYYCFTILASYCRDELAHRRLKAIEEIEKRIIDFQGVITTELHKWKLDFLKFSELIRHPGSFSRIDMDALAFFLLVGVHNNLTFKQIGESESGFVQYMAFNESYKEYCYINKGTGFWEVSRSEFQEADVKWYRQDS